jgi:hypothetical protein
MPGAGASAIFSLPQMLLMRGLLASVIMAQFFNAVSAEKRIPARSSENCAKL